MIRPPPRSTLSSSSAASDVYKRQGKPGDWVIAPVGQADSQAPQPRHSVSSTSRVTTAPTRPPAIRRPSKTACRVPMKRKNLSWPWRRRPGPPTARRRSRCCPTCGPDRPLRLRRWRPSRQCLDLGTGYAFEEDVGQMETPASVEAGVLVPLDVLTDGPGCA